MLRKKLLLPITIVVAITASTILAASTLTPDPHGAGPVSNPTPTKAVPASNGAESPAPQDNGHQTADKVYQALRQGPNSFSPEFATVNNLVLKRDAGTFTLSSGEVYFLTPVEGRVVGAVFLGSGSFDMSVPTSVEAANLAIFTDGGGIHEAFNQLVLNFTDQTFDEIKNSPNAKMGTAGGQSGRAHDAYQSLWRKTKENFELRALMDLYAPARPGVFKASINGQRFNKLLYTLDPLGQGSLSPDQVVLYSYGETDGGIWASFQLSSEYHEGRASTGTDRRIIDLTNHVIDATVKGAHLSGTDRLDFTPRLTGERVIPFDLYGGLRVSSVKDAGGQSLDFIQEDKDKDADFAVILPQAAEVGKSVQLTVEYSGDGALKDAGGGNFTLEQRGNWFPANPHATNGDRAKFDLTFHYPKSITLVGVEALASPETTDGDTKTAHWTTGTMEFAVAGFNYGKFVKKEVADKNTGLNIEFYANQEPPDEFKDLQMQIDDLKRKGYVVEANLDVISPASMANSALADTQNSVGIYNLFFGKLPFTRIAMSQQPHGNFGQAWPTLIYMPYLAFIDSNQRFQLMGTKGGTDSYWTYVGPHEISHQWWGHTVGWKSYRDQWMSEGFAEFSTSLYAQFIRKDEKKFLDLWDGQRKKITEATEITKNRKPYTVGPISLGHLLSNAKTGATYDFLVYPKGAYVLQMIRFMMFDPRNGNDKNFIEMMHDFVTTYYNQDVTTDDFKHMVEKHMTPGMDVGRNKTMDWFFDEWVDGTDIPSYKFDYQIGTNADGKTTISGKITQSGVSKNFAMPVPIYLDFGSGWVRLGSITLVGNSSFDLPAVPLAQAPKRVTLCARDDVLYTDLTVTKH